MSTEPSINDMFNAIFNIPNSKGKTTAKPIRKAQMGWMLSYNPYCADTDCAETAIILGPNANSIFLILYGDHVTELDGKPRDFAVQYWQSRPELWGATTNHIED